MFLFLGRRLMLAILTLLVVSLITFILGYFAPGGPLDMLLGPRATPEARRRLEHQFGLDRPPWEQYGRFLWNGVRGDLGTSFSDPNLSVTRIIAERFPATALLACLAMAVACLAGLSAGLLAALQHNRLADRVVMGAVILFVSVPSIVLAPVLMRLFALRLGWLPLGGWEWDSPRYFVLPVVVLAARPAALLARFMRASMLDVIRQDYIRAAHARGVAPSAVILRHALKNAFVPVLTVLGTNLGYLLTGSFVVESIFSVPGIGQEAVNSIIRRDYSVIQGIGLLVAAIFIFLNLVVDLLYGLIDPRLRTDGGPG